MSTKVSTDLIDLSSNTGGLVWAKGTTAQQPASATAGEMRVDTTTNTTLVYNGTQWKTLKETAFVVPPVPTQFLVVAGGGGGGGAGGAGAGGLLTTYATIPSTSSGNQSQINLSLSTAYTITVGTGGAGSGIVYAPIGTVGVNSSISGSFTGSPITAAGGGAGGASSGSNGGDGGSGGGSGWSTSGGTATPTGQGFDGGSGIAAPNYSGGGGGGASETPITPTQSIAGAGGEGVTVSITGSAVGYAGGGGAAGYTTAIGSGAAPAVGGGGAGRNWGGNTGSAPTPSAGVYGKGGGGGSGGSGGSGVVILRYPTADLPYFTTTGTLNTPSATDTVADAAYPVANTAYYKLDSNANDSSGNGYNGTASNVTYGNGRFNEAGNFNGTNSIISLPSNLISGTTDSDYSVSMWVKFNTLPTSNFISLIGPNLSVFRLLLYYNSGSTYNVNLLRTFGGSYYYTSASTGIQATLSTGQYYNIIVTYQSSNKLVNGYLNGNPIGSYTLNLSASGTAGAPILGSYNGSTLYNLNGSLDQMRIFSSALAPGDVEDLYNEHFQTKFTDGSDTALKFTGGTGDITFADTAPVFTPSDNFNTVAYAGNGGTQAITTGFTPDLVWTKQRSSPSRDHLLNDSVRGANKILYSNLTNAQDTAGGPSSAYFNSFDSNGYTIGSSQYYNDSSLNYVSWSWKAGGAARNNTDGTITSQVSANVDAGFSIVKWTGNDLASQTIGHGLSSTPELYIIKKTSAALAWQVNLSSLVTGTEGYLLLDRTLPMYTTFPNYYTSANNTVLSTNGTSTAERQYNNQSANYIAYCFHSIAGYSKIGSYTGTGSDLSVNVSFEPAFIMIKCVDNSGSAWFIVDNKRGAGAKGVAKFIEPSSSGAEFTNAVYGCIFTSTGFTIPGGTSVNLNQNGIDYIYMTFATNPT